MKVLIFDMWGTIIENGVYPSPLRQIRRILRINAPFPEYITKFEDVFMLNKFENLTDAFHEVSKAFNIKPPSFVIDKCVGLWNKNAILAKPFPESIEVLEELKKKYKLVLVSNTDQFSSEQVIKKFNLDQYFEKVILSYKFGKLKTNPKFFDAVLKDLKVAHKDAVMIGDSLESDVKPAEDAGIKAILVDRKDRREHANKVNSLVQIESML